MQNISLEIAGFLSALHATALRRSGAQKRELLAAMRCDVGLPIFRTAAA